MTDELAVVEQLQLGSLSVQPAHIVDRASRIATELASVIRDRKLYTSISGRNYVRVDGWTTLGAMLGVLPREVSVTEGETGDIEAVVELIRVSDGAIIGRGSAILGMDEKTWASRPHYARRSMAITRATGKAFRLCFSWIISLAGYETTPAEEMDGLTEGEFKPVRPEPEKPARKEAETLTIEEARAVVNSQGVPYGELAPDTLAHMANQLVKSLKGDLPAEERAEKERKLTACRVILAHKEG